MASFAAPTSATYSPNLPQPGSPADNWAFAVMLVVFEGKMRALFSILFGASLLLFVDRQDQQGRDCANIAVDSGRAPGRVSGQHSAVPGS